MSIHQKRPTFLEPVVFSWNNEYAPPEFLILFSRELVKIKNTGRCATTDIYKYLSSKHMHFRGCSPRYPWTDLYRLCFQLVVVSSFGLLYYTLTLGQLSCPPAHELDEGVVGVDGHGDEPEKGCSAE